MSQIIVQEPGLLTTVQDLGREGFGPMGVSPSGAADAIALRIGNRLVGNLEGCGWAGNDLAWRDVPVSGGCGGRAHGFRFCRNSGWRAY